MLGTLIEDLARKRLVGPNTYGINNDTISHSTAEGQRNYAQQGFTNAGLLRGNVKLSVNLPNDTTTSYRERAYQQVIQSVQPWGNAFMVTPTDAARLNNNAQASAVKQKQLGPPNSYGQFYSMMQFLSAAFGTLRSA